MEIDDIEQAIFGYKVGNLPKLEELDGTENWSGEQWEDEFNRTSLWLETFFAARDPLVVLARTAIRYFFEASQPRDGSQKVRPLEQVEVEIAQAFLLMGDTIHKKVPISPGNFIRYWGVMFRHIHCFISKQPVSGVSTSYLAAVQMKARLQTLYYRNLFTRADCETTMRTLLQRIDLPSEKTLGYRLSDLFEAMLRVVSLVEARIQEFAQNIQNLMSSEIRSDVLESISFFRSCYPLADRVWHKCEGLCLNIEKLRYAGFQMSELAWPWVFTLDRTTLEASFAPYLIAALNSLALPMGSLRGTDPQHIYLNNPIWKKPYIRLAEQSLFVPQPYLAFSFPFAIMEDLIAEHSELQSAYVSARAEYLEAEINALVCKAMPNAKVHRSVVWTDPETNKRWENDVVVLLENFVFVFEAKSGRIGDSARRGGEGKLRKNFRDLFVEPGLQGWRLQNYLDQYQKKAVLRRKSDNSVIDLGIDRPKVVYRYSICFEHFTTLTSSRSYLKELGLIKDDTAWAPILTLGELKMIARHLDTEVSFQHYFTRRQSLDELIDFDGDEQDILSMYLINGFWVDSASVQGSKLAFFEADGPVRRPNLPKSGSHKSLVRGVQLSPLWNAIVNELYACKGQPHRFDIINVALNQFPPALVDMERNIRRFRRGAYKEASDIMITKYRVGKKIFVLACYVAKFMPDLNEWREIGRGIIGMFADENTVVDCAAFIFLRRSKRSTFDSASFYRTSLGGKPTDVGG